MPQMSLTVDLADDKDIAHASAFMKAIAEDSAYAEMRKAHAVEATPEPPKTTRTRKPKDEDPTTEDFIVYKADGTKRAGYAFAKDAADVLVFAAQELLAHAELLEFGKHNMSTIAKLDKENQAKVTAAISKHVAEVKEKEAAAKAAAETPPETATPSDPLAELFGGTVETKPTDAPTMSRQDFIDEMVKLGQGLGAQASKAWATEVKLGNPADVPAERFNDLVEKGKAHLAMLKQGA